MGIFVALFKDTNIYKLFSQYIDPVFWPDNVIPENTKLFKSFIYSFSGTYVLLWGLIYFLFQDLLSNLKINGHGIVF